MGKDYDESSMDLLKKLCAHDKDLADEVSGKLDRRRVERERAVLDIASAAEPLSQHERSIRRRREESIVRAMARPVLLIRDNTFVTEFVGPQSEVWQNRLLRARSVLDRAIPAVGRIEVQNHPTLDWVGTGWLIDRNIVVTNRHVAREFARRSEQDFQFRIGSDQRTPISARVDFREEHKKRRSFEVSIGRILWIAPINDLDLAFLELSHLPGATVPLPIPLSEKLPVADTPVVTIGYPARDDNIPDQQLVQQVFGDVYDKKRLAPGYVTDSGAQDVLHDCSTLGGNSGSVVLDIASGKAVAIHYAGEFMETNYAVPAAVVADRLRQLRNGPLSPRERKDKVFHGHSELTKRFSIPLEVTVRIGEPATIDAVSMHSDTADLSPAQAAESLRAKLDGDQNVIDVRAGFRFINNVITDERAIVVVVEDKSAVNLARIPKTHGGYRVVVRYGSLAQQLRHRGNAMIDFLERRVEKINYQEPAGLTLDEVDEKMDAIFHASPDAGFPVLSAFLQRIEKSLVATIYEFDGKHILQALIDALEPGDREFLFVTQEFGRENSDNATCNLDQPDCDLDLRRAVDELKIVLGDRFDHVAAPTTMSDQLFATAYHIKVAVRDDKELWLSSGNFKGSGQPNIDPVADNETSFEPLDDFNREWHAVIKNEKLAETFASYIKYDFDESKKVHASRPALERASFPLPDVLIPEPAVVALERREQATYFEPLVLEDEQLRIQPLLTPDNYIDFVPNLIRSATQRVYVQNQSFNLKADDNEPQFEDLMQALVDQQNNGLDVRIISRDVAKEFGTDLRALVERLSDFGFDTSQIRFQVGCHNKGLIVDSTIVMLGSHNWTNSGILVNRDASLIVHHAQVAEYYEKLFLFDWENLATQQVLESVSGIKVASPEEETPEGMRRIPIEEAMLL